MKNIKPLNQLSTIKTGSKSNYLYYACGALLITAYLARPPIISIAESSDQMTAQNTSDSDIKNSIQPFTQEAWNKVRAKGGMSVLQFHAEWCPTCREQSSALNEESHSPQSKDITFFRVDYDNDSDFNDSLKVTRQSTIIIFKGEKEVARGVGGTSTQQISKLISTGLANAKN